jgi:uncharacterized protein involved in exopolysaccharide biosynthesis
MREIEIQDSHEEVDIVGEQPRDAAWVGEVTLLDLSIVLAQNKRLIAGATFGAAIVATIIALILPNRYTAEAKILPPQQAQSSLTAMLGQFNSIGGLAGLAGLAGRDLGLKNPADLYVGVLRSRSVFDAIIDRFDLKRYYQDKNMADARRDLDKHTLFEAGKDGLITISVEHKNAQRAAEIANAFIEQLHEANKRLAISEASQRRLFFEQQLDEEKKSLADAEVRLKKTQERTGLIKLDSQAEAIIRSVAALKAEVTVKEVQLQAMRSFATEQNPDFVRLQQELVALRGQLAKAELNEQMGGGNVELPTGKIPEAGLEYVRKYRDVKYHESLFEVLAKEYEAARIDEGRNAPIIQVVDQAIVPDKRSGPPRTLIVVLSALTGWMVACFWAWTRAAYYERQKDAKTREKLLMLKHSLMRLHS